VSQYVLAFCIIIFSLSASAITKASANAITNTQASANVIANIKANANPNADGVAQALLDRLAQQKTLVAHFTQSVYGEDKHLIQSVTGVMRLSQPKKFYWATDMPSNQIIVADGEVIWIYDKDLAQVVRRRQDQLASLPAQLLSGSLTELTGDYQVLVTHQDGKSIYTLTTKQVDASFVKLILVFEHDTITEMTMFDTLGQKSTFQFNHVIANQPIAAKWFKFVPANGVDVIIE